MSGTYTFGREEIRKKVKKTVPARPKPPGNNLKKMRRKMIVGKKADKHILDEQRALRVVRSRFVCAIHYAYATPESVPTNHNGCRSAGSGRCNIYLGDAFATRTSGNTGYQAFGMGSVPSPPPQGPPSPPVLPPACRRACVLALLRGVRHDRLLLDHLEA